MTLQERSELMQRLYRMQGDLAALYEACRVHCAVGVGSHVQTAQTAVNEALDEFRPDSPAPAPMEFPRNKN